MSSHQTRPGDKIFNFSGLFSLHLSPARISDVVIIEFHLNRNRQTNNSLQTKNAERIVSIDFKNTKYGVYLKNKMSHKNVEFIEI